MGSCASPALPASYADVDGNIGFRLSGFIPLRRTGGGRLPAPGWDRSWDWRGYIPFQGMAAGFNPPPRLILPPNKPLAHPRFPPGPQPPPARPAPRLPRRIGAARGNNPTVWPTPPA